MDTGDDIWIYPSTGKVLIEYWHSGRITATEIHNTVQLLISRS